MITHNLRFSLNGIVFWTAVVMRKTACFDDHFTRLKCYFDVHWEISMKTRQQSIVPKGELCNFCWFLLLLLISGSIFVIANYHAIHNFVRFHPSSRNDLFSSRFQVVHKKRNISKYTILWKVLYNSFRSLGSWKDICFIQWIVSINVIIRKLFKT